VTPPRRRKPAAKRPSRYHHGNLPHAMLQEAVRLIQREGVEALTLRGVGARLGVSRTALYRHFTSKQALLTAVAAEGFRTLRSALAEAWESGGRGNEGFRAMGLAYVRFAVTHPSHYRVMFGGTLQHADHSVVRDADTDAFQVLLDAIVELQGQGLVRGGDPRHLAMYIWAVVHGVSMLALDGMLPGMPAIDLMTFVNERMRTGLAP
jgi:AcrR family transcriptional regulator